MKAEIILTRKYRETMLKDSYRPAYHLAICDDLEIPGDPNGAFYADGVYHFMYLYRNLETEGCLGDTYQALICFIGDIIPTH